VDPVETNQKFAAALAVDYPILSDPMRNTARAYGVLAPSGHARRQTFYIGADGRILAIDANVSPASHGDDIVAKLTHLKVQHSGR
jgi:peroxiredoxin Q/BCP